MEDSVVNALQTVSAVVAKVVESIYCDRQYILIVFFMYHIFIDIYYVLCGI